MSDRPGLSRPDYQNLLAFRRGLHRFLNFSQAAAHSIGSSSRNPRSDGPATRRFAARDWLALPVRPDSPR